MNKTVEISRRTYEDFLRLSANKELGVNMEYFLRCKALAEIALEDMGTDYSTVFIDKSTVSALLGLEVRNINEEA